MPDDAIDALAGIAPGSALDALRRRRPLTRTHSQASHEALFHPAEPGGVTLAERHAVAAYVAGLHRDAAAVASHAAGLDAGLAAAVARAVEETQAEGPYGRYPEGPLSREDQAGPAFALSADTEAALGPCLAAALAHAHYLVFRPRDADAEELRKLQAAGWDADAVVTLSQITAFLSYQLRVAAALRVLEATP
jgi:CMD domain protein